MFLIYLPAASPRCEYIFKKIFTEEFGIGYKVTTDVSTFENYAEEKLNYSNQRFSDEFFIKSSGLLFENFIADKDVVVGEENGVKILFGNDNPCDLGFDIFSAVFYMLSRYEEYLPFSADQYGRYAATNSLAYTQKFLQIAVVDHWILNLKQILINRFPLLQFKPSKFEIILTYDIDVAYKFKGRSIIRNAGAIVKDIVQLNFENLSSRNKTLTDQLNDPWDTYQYVREIIKGNNFQSIFFFLLGDRSAHDRNLNYERDEMHALINEIKSFSDIGIHPSFKSSLATVKILQEKKRLETISGKNINKSRQHFLKFKLPNTYNALADAGIEQEYSMGYPYVAGFRAGTSKPFYFYDLKNESATNLKVFPVTFMDGNFMQEKNVSSKNVLRQIAELISEVKSVEGTFISIWHNHTVSNTKDFKKWRQIHDQMVMLLKDKA